MTRVLFVCLGNICRSPTAHGVFESLVKAKGLAEQIHIDSCGTGGWHIGESPDKRATAHARKRGYDLSHLRARQVQSNDFYEFDYILAMDEANLRELDLLCPKDAKVIPQLFLSFGDYSETEVPDPYYGGERGFEHVLDLVESACEGLLEDILSK
ncbi:phosphotyrosine protein phosphatase [Oleiphilus sp. HI0071]|jgi:protein-tyrosine phosphatase|nr:MULTISPECIES: low molecular weight protein-tyrosine-phosphatase [unclassified Oleiphilus]KZY61005.1 phosphotyrosine protein phosphatase [Oleiphilus sp. HI0065]KZY79676.1 phosphotyrosine protein phosphatase [Oleiphilus sp. HI0071]KZZ06173.1 phosphotyrosine protein phosphatase [Oleiphilus sp. HI0073]KZZ40109.1 phosphotyrosine protein phosphatase [Oleiphilus sp. HI0118]KZZ51985.1 phosphotyrosine protein phosphatase [Oleiphilus sp. HI0122]KZZ64019.1 phosphotyrosine protein phosphatase [Oleiphi